MMKSSIRLVVRFAICVGFIGVTISHPSIKMDLARRQGLAGLMGGMGGSGGGMGGIPGLGGGGTGGAGGLGNMMGGMGGGGMGGLGGMMGGLGGGADNSGGGGCKKYRIISARGTGENQARPTGYARFISGVMAAVPDGGNYEVRYPATVDYMNGPIQGSADALRYITSQQSSCPKQLYVMIGYSEGAMVITQLMNRPTLPASQVVAVVLYGNPYFKGGAPQNSCSAKGGAGIAAATGIRMPDKFSGITYDCCLTGDMICQTAGSIVPHLAYPGSPSEQAAVKYAVGKLQGGGGAAGGGGGDTPPSGNSTAGGGGNPGVGGGGLGGLGGGGLGGLGGGGLGGLGGGGLGGLLGKGGGGLGGGGLGGGGLGGGGLASMLGGGGGGMPGLGGGSGGMPGLGGGAGGSGGGLASMLGGAGGGGAGGLPGLGGGTGGLGGMFGGGAGKGLMGGRSRGKRL